MSLRIAENLELPEEAVTQTFAILAKRGVGKTYTASVFVEEIIKARLPVAVIDPVGVWWGLRASADGRRAGLPIVIAGGDHADVPITPSSGEAVARLVVEENLSLVIDLSTFRKGEQTRFMTAFAETLYHLNRAPRHLVLDEADAFAPQRPQQGEQRMLGAMEDIVRRGRARGLGVTLISQRSAALNKNVLTQAEVLVTLRLISPQDRGAVDDWVKTHGTEEQRNEMMGSLPSLPVGAAWFWSPGWLDIFQRVKVRERETFDSSSTPKVGQLVKAPEQLAPVELEAIRQRLAAAVGDDESDDPKELRRQLRELRGQLDRQEPREVVRTVEVPVLRQEDATRLQETAAALIALGTELRDALPRVAPVSSSTPIPKPAATEQAGARAGWSPAESEAINDGAARILQVLAAHQQLSRFQLATLAGFSPRSGTYSTYLGQLRRQGLIDSDQTGVRITPAGRAHTRELAVAPVRTTDDLLGAWRERLLSGERRIFDILVEAYPQPLSRQELARRAGLSAGSGTYSTYLGKLRRNGIIESAGASIRASESLFLSKVA